MIKMSAIKPSAKAINFTRFADAAKLGMKVKEFGTHELRRLAGGHKQTANTFTLAWRTGLYIARELVPQRFR